MDFNVAKMAAVVREARRGCRWRSMRIVGAYDTPDMIRQIKGALLAV